MKKPTPKTIALIIRTIVGLVLLFAAIQLMLFLIATKPTVSKSALNETSVAVQVIRVEPVTVARPWRGYGVTQAKATADIPARIGATVTSVPEGIEVGRVVQAGQLIAELDPTDFRNTLGAAEKRIAEAEAGIQQLTTERNSLQDRLALEQEVIELARDDYDRQLARAASGSAAPADVDRAKRALLGAELSGKLLKQQLDAIPSRLAGIRAQQAVAIADRDTAEVNLARTTITSPIAGIIETLDIKAGENLAPGQRVARIIDPRVIELPLQLPASARGFVATGNQVTLTVRSQPDDCPPWTATVTRLGVADNPTRTFTAFAEVDQSRIPLRNFAEGTGPHKLSAGVFTLARLDTAEPKQQTIIPARSIQEGRIRTVVDGKIVGLSVEVAFDLEGDFEQFGLDDSQWVALKQPLPTGTLVVLSASMTILDGQRVETRSASPRDDATARAAEDSP